jgi:hypothetical protein
VNASHSKAKDWKITTCYTHEVEWVVAKVDINNVYTRKAGLIDTRIVIVPIDVYMIYQ